MKNICFDGEFIVSAYGIKRTRFASDTRNVTISGKVTAPALQYRSGQTHGCGGVARQHYPFQLCKRTRRYAIEEV